MRNRALVLLTTIGLLLPTSGAWAQPTRSKTTIRVIAGSPSEFRFKLSKLSAQQGVVVFRVTNKGVLPHDFRIAGKQTPLLRPGASRTLRVVFRRPDRYPYRCTVPGHAAAGMKGVLRVR